MLKDYWIECFKAGTHTDSAGNTHSYSVDDIDKIVHAYNNQPTDEKHEAPVVIGHPEEDKPAYGWVEKLKRDGEILFAKLHGLTDEFVDWVKQGFYKKRSIALYPDLTLRHIGFLGAVPPAIKGLTDPSFKDGVEFIRIEFSDENKSTVTVLQEQRSKRYNIQILDGARAEKPEYYKGLSDEQFADPVNYSLPLSPSLIRATLATWNRDVIRNRYSEREQQIIAAKIIMFARECGVNLTPYKWAYSELNNIYQLVKKYISEARKNKIKNRPFELAEYIAGVEPSGTVAVPTDLLNRNQLIKVINEHLTKKQSISDLTNNSSQMEEASMLTISQEQFDKFKTDLLTFITETFPEDIGSQIASKIEELSTAIKPEGSAEPPAGEGAAASEGNDNNNPAFAEVNQLKQRIAELETDRRLTSFNQFIEAQITAGVVVPKQKNLIMSALEIGHNAGVVKFAEEDNKLTDKKGSEVIMNLVKSFPKQVEFKEITPSNNGGNNFVAGFKDIKLPSGDGVYQLSEDTESLELHTKVMTYVEEQQKAGKTVTYLEALNVIKGS